MHCMYNLYYLFTNLYCVDEVGEETWNLLFHVLTNLYCVDEVGRNMEPPFSAWRSARRRHCRFCRNYGVCEPKKLSACDNFTADIKNCWIDIFSISYHFVNIKYYDQLLLDLDISNCSRFHDYYWFDRCNRKINIEHDKNVFKWLFKDKIKGGKELKMNINIEQYKRK